MCVFLSFFLKVCRVKVYLDGNMGNFKWNFELLFEVKIPCGEEKPSKYQPQIWNVFFGGDESHETAVLKGFVMQIKFVLVIAHGAGRGIIQQKCKHIIRQHKLKKCLNDDNNEKKSQH